MRLLVLAAYAALVVCLFAIPNTVQAQNCRTAYPVAYHAPVYAAPVYYDYNQIIVAKAFQVQVAQPFYMGVADEYRQAFFAERVAEKLAQILELQRQHLRDAGGDAAVPDKLPLSAAKPATKISAVLEKRCVECHKPGKQAPDLSGDPSLISDVVRLKAFKEVSRGRMPKGKSAIPQEEFNIIGDWADGTPAERIPPAKRD